MATRAGSTARPTASGVASSSTPIVSTPSSSGSRHAKRRTWTPSSASRWNCRGRPSRTPATVRASSPAATPACTWASATGTTPNCSNRPGRRSMPIFRPVPPIRSSPTASRITSTWLVRASSTTPPAPVRWCRYTRRCAPSRTAKSRPRWPAVSTCAGRSTISSPSARTACCPGTAAARPSTAVPTVTCVARAGRCCCSSRCAARCAMATASTR